MMLHVTRGKNGAGDRNRTGDLPLTRKRLDLKLFVNNHKKPFG